MEEQKVDRLGLLVVEGSQAGMLMKDLQQEGFYFTVIDTSGGLINAQIMCLMLGFPHERLPVLVDLARKHCQPYQQYIPAQIQPPMDLAMLPMVEAQSGGGLVYLMNVDRFEQF